MQAGTSLARAIAIGRHVGCLLSALDGLFWLGALYWLAFRHHAINIDRDGYQALVPPALLWIFVVGPSVACILGGWLTYRAVRGWRWGSIIVCVFYAVMLSNTRGVGWLFVGWNAAVVALIALPDPHRRASGVNTAPAAASGWLRLPAWGVVPLAVAGLGLALAAFR